MTDHLKELSAQGVSIWLDDLFRPLITSGGLQRLIDTSCVVGVTTNPSIFAAALSQGDSYNEQIKGLATEDKTVDEAMTYLKTSYEGRPSKVLFFNAEDGVKYDLAVRVIDMARQVGVNTIGMMTDPPAAAGAAAPAAAEGGPAPVPAPGQ